MDIAAVTSPAAGWGSLWCERFGFGPPEAAQRNLAVTDGWSVSCDAVSTFVCHVTLFCTRVHVAGLNKGGMDTFMDNLPGFPDNIRPSSTGGYWVAMSAVRPNPGFSMLDFLSQRPWIKKFIFKVKTDFYTHLKLDLIKMSEINESDGDGGKVMVVTCWRGGDGLWYDVDARADTVNVRAKMLVQEFVQEHGLHLLAPEWGRVISVMSPDVGTRVACVSSRQC